MGDFYVHVEVISHDEGDFALLEVKIAQKGWGITRRRGFATVGGIVGELRRGCGGLRRRSRDPDAMC
jgi:hypothetical protein